MKRAALFGGSFDPPHIGHVEIVNELKNLDFIDEVIVMPTYLNPFKERFTAPASKRLEWLKKLFESERKVVVSDFEVKQKRKVPTYETLQELKKKYDEVYIAIGADNLPTLHKWYNFDKIEQEAKFIVATREGFELPKEHYLTIEVTQPVSSTQLRDRIDKTQLPPKIAEEIDTFYKDTNATKS